MEPKNYNKVMDDLNELIYSIDYNKEMKDPLAFTYRNILDREGSTYKIVCNNSVDEMTPYLLMHEAGHIIFNHCIVNDTEGLLIKGKIKAAWNKISQYFEDYDEEEVFNYFESFLYNVTMDWEVNSKYFDMDEILNLEKLTSEYIGTECQLMYPTRMNYPIQKSWIEYITMITMDPEKFFKNMEDQKRNQKDGNGKGQGNGKSKKTQNKKNSNQNDSNDGSGSSKGDSDKKDQNRNNGQGSEQEQGVKKLSELPEDQRKEIVDKIVSDMKKAYEKKQDEEKQKENYRKNNDDGGSISNGNGHGIGNSHCAVEIDEPLDVETYSDKTLKDQLLKCLNTKKQFKTKRDLVYHYNRNKYNSNVMHIKYRKEEKITKNNMVVLLDVSGSISFGNVSKFIEAFKEVSRQLRRKCSLILWDTDLVAEYNDVSDNINPFCGGGTDMASGLRYIQDNKKYNDSTVIIVSDFEDDLDDWKINRKIYGICWSQNSFNYAMQNYIRNENEFKKMFKKILIQEEK